MKTEIKHSDSHQEIDKSFRLTSMTGKFEEFFKTGYKEKVSELFECKWCHGKYHSYYGIKHAKPCRFNGIL